MKTKQIRIRNQRTATVVLSAVLPLFLGLTGCDQKNDSSTDTSSTYSTSTNSGTTSADNSANNRRDRNSATLTPGDQGNTPADRDITQKIRQALVAGTTNVSGTNDFSMTAKNVKIITTDGKVTLRGPVNTAEEKTGIELIAKNVAGDANVDDQLEVKTNP